MTDEQIEKFSAAYVLARQLVRHNAKKAEDATMSDFDKTRKSWNALDLMQAYEDGMRDALSHQWVSVDKRLPEEYRTVLTYIDNDDFRELKIALAHWDGEDWYDIKDSHIRPSHWLPIPQLNPEK